MKIYQNTQRATSILGFIGVMFLGMGLFTFAFRPFVFAVIILALIVWIFRSMTVEISERELTWYFGAGWPRKHVLLSEVASAEVIRTSLMNGWGIHYTPRGRLYNVSGFGAVAIKLRSGKQFCLGTDEPEKLAWHLRPFAASAV